MIAKPEPPKLTIKGENLLIFVIIIGNSSFRMQDCRKKPIIILNINKRIRGILKFQLPSCDLTKRLMLLWIPLKKVKLASLKE